MAFWFLVLLALASSSVVDPPQRLIPASLTEVEVGGRPGPIINAWLQSNPKIAFNGIEPQAVADRLKDLCRNPRLIAQGRLTLCGPATFFFFWIRDHDEDFATFATTLCTYGRAKIGNVWVIPPKDELDYQKAKEAYEGSEEIAKKPQEEQQQAKDEEFEAWQPQADWVVLGSLRSSHNDWVSFNGKIGSMGDALSGLTLPGKMAEWFTDSGAFRVDYTNLHRSTIWDVVDHVLKLGEELGDLKKKKFAAALINSRMLTDPSVKTESTTDDSPIPPDVQDYVPLWVPTHWIALLQVQDLGDMIEFSYVTWGDKRNSKVPKSLVKEAYHGGVYGVRL